MPKTQRDSYNEIKPSLGQRQQEVLEVIKANIQGLPLFKITELLRMPVNRVSGRVTELKKCGLIADSGERAVNPDSGKAAIVWRAA